MDRFRLRLPATSANLGPGFDAVAVALDFALGIEAEVAREFAIAATGRDAERCGRLHDNLILEIYKDLLGANGRPIVPLALRVTNGIPLGPHHDLCLSEWHAVFVDGVLIPVGSLINGTTIRRFEASEFTALEYFNIKLESHDVIRAEGAPVETLLEVDDRAVNFAAYLRTCGVPATNATPCAPVAPYGGLGELGQEFAARSRPGLIAAIRLR